jgi:glycosyltransferase involved in cell wall biosynthesis
MPQLSTIVTLTSKTSPHTCGVGDYTINLATHCQTQLDLDLNIVVETTCDRRNDTITIHPIVADWSPTSLQALLTDLTAANVQTVMLQYTCWSYSPTGLNLHLIPFWQQCAQRFQTLLIAHETFNPWSLKHPGTWLLSPRQKYLLQQLVQSSHQVFCGSEVYLRQIERLTPAAHKLHYLPIPSNIPPHPLTIDQRQDLYQKLNIPPHRPILALFGCKESIRQDWLVKLDRDLNQLNQPIQWLLLGKAQQIAAPLLNPVLRPGRLSPSQLSHHLQLTDLLLMPHEFGISAKRGSLMAALEHGIPIVGTDGHLTDAFFRQLDSIQLATDGNYPQFFTQVTHALAHLPALCDAAKTTQTYYQEHLSWSVVTQTLAPYLKISC